jgi:hypothetical protein
MPPSVRSENARRLSGRDISIMSGTPYPETGGRKNVHKKGIDPEADPLFISTRYPRR